MTRVRSNIRNETAANLRRLIIRHRADMRARLREEAAWADARDSNSDPKGEDGLPAECDRRNDD